MKKISPGDVIVITGASSGIGRTLAEELALAKVHLVLLSRGLEKLNQVAQKCQALGATTEVHSVDVTDAEDLQIAVAKIYETNKRIDVWVNNAGLGAIGNFTDIPLKDHLNVLNTNIQGYFVATYAVLKIFKQQGRGILINNGSISAHVFTPHAASYNTSKHAVRALTKSLQQDLKMEGPHDIHICLINPEVTDTPAFDNAVGDDKNPMRVRMPMVTARQVALRMIKLMQNPQEEVFVGKLAILGSYGQRFFPWLASALLRWTAGYYYQSHGENEPSVKGR